MKRHGAKNRSKLSSKKEIQSNKEIKEHSLRRNSKLSSKIKIENKQEKYGNISWAKSRAICRTKKEGTVICQAKKIENNRKMVENWYEVEKCVNVSRVKHRANYRA